MDLAVLQQIAGELNELLPGGFIQKIHQPLPREIVLRIRSRAGELKLMMSADPLLGRIHLTKLKIPNPPRPLRFCAFLRAHLQGARVVQVDAAGTDRVVRILAVRGPEQEKVRRELVLELLGRDSNIILINPDDQVIMDCLHHIPEKDTGNRIVLPGSRYSFPPARPNRVISDYGPFKAGTHAGISSISGGKKKITLQPGPGDEAFSSVNEAADALYGAELVSALTAALRREVASPIVARIKSLDRRLPKIEDDIKRIQEYADRQEEGELIKSNLSRIRKGMTRVQVRDWSTGRDREINLNPALDPVGNMNLIFKKGAKAKRGKKMAQERLRVTLEEKKAFEDLLYFVQEAADISELERIAAETVKPQAPENRAKKGEKKVSENMFWSFTSPGGHLVLVGRSATGNDVIVRNKSRKGDLWFHIKDVPGAHVLLTRKENRPVKPEDREFGAGLAVHFSKGRGKGKMEVIVADAGDISRPKGSVPGRVSVKKYTTILSAGSQGDSVD